MRPDFPFSAVVGQDDLKLALVLVAIDPTIGGVLITGERGTAKSTAARGLAALLPKTPEGKAAPFVELPIGATEDRVVGSLDISRVLQDGGIQLRSGLLARANGGVLYVDEVNLLPDHIVDLLLDAAASGWVTVERDGISAGEAAGFVLVGTMNPEEGELRPQFVDRFGLCVQVRGLNVHDTRIAAIRGRLSFDDQPASVLEAVQPAEHALRQGIVAARGRLSTLPITDAHLSVVAALSVEHQLDGIRGDLAIIKAARALAAWQAEPGIRDEHIHRAAQLALSHRTRQKKSKSRPPAPTSLDPPDPNRASGESEAAPSAGATHASESPRLQFAPPGPDHGPVRLVTDMIDRGEAGRRGTDSLSSQRVVGAVSFDGTGTLAITQTLAAAAARGARVGGRGVRLAASDLKQHERRGPGLCHVLFLVDASGSMATKRRMEVAKGAALGLLTSNYQRRDEVALMVFRAEGTDLVLPFTRHITSIEQAMGDVPTGGRTPLARALLDATCLLRTREPALLVLLTDGRANVSVDGGDPWEEAVAACQPARAACAGALVIDCEPGPIVLGRARVLAQALGAECIALDAMDAAALAIRIHGRLESS
ncbi:MAG TPA: VWA domain-containing protein [Steroidobacteraceae bacterium]|nr:VWA domain-containing protein [Steroidobacteraceae bacterium]